MSNVHVIAIITAKPGMRDRILTAFEKNVGSVRAERGCIEYLATTDVENAGCFQSALGEDSFAVVEKWESLEALKDHLAAPHMANYSQSIRDMVADRKILVLEPA